MASVEEIEKLVRARGACKAQVTGFSKILDKFEAKSELSDLDIIEIENRLLKMNLISEKFDTVQENLEFIVDLAELEKENAERVMFDESYFKATARAKLLIKMCHVKNAVDNQAETESTLSDAAQATGGHISNLVKLPIIPLPKFHGDYDKWLEFREIFGSLIHENAALNEIQKFHYLRASLEGAASEVVRSLDFSRENYDIAWNALCDRFNNTRLLVHRHVKSLFALQSIENESARELRRVIDLVSKSLNSLAQLNEPTEHWDTLIIYLISTKLDTVTAREWEQFKCINNTPSWGEFKDFLKGRADLLETLEQREKVKRCDIRDRHQRIEQKKGSHRGDGMNGSRGLFSSNIRCAFCKKDHHIINCEDFLRLPVNHRIEKARNLKLCLNCLKFGHLGRVCRGSLCAKCKGKHNALLHLEYDKGEKVDNNKSVEKSDREAEGQSVALSSSGVNSHVLLSTARIEVMDKNGKYHTARAILDSGSQSSFVTLNLCNNLNIAKENVNITVGGLGQTASEIKYTCKIKIRSLHNAFETDINCLVLYEITGLVPNIRLNAKNIEIPKNIRLADPSYYKPEKIDILVGADLFYKLLCIGQISLNNEGAILQKTRFGWIVSGPIQADIHSRMICNFSNNMQPQFDMQKFWEIESDFSTSVKELSKEQVDCEAHFQKTIRRDENGRFIVSLPLKKSIENLGETEKSAKGRFLSLERRFESNGELKRKYIEFMSEYQSMGHMSEVSVTSNDKNVYYMPHHGVLRDDSLTTKLRVVFNASAPSTTGTSLNDLQMVGPVLQKDLISHLLSFRQHRYVVSADIAKMYRQVLLEPCQRKLQRIIWREDTSEPLKIFQLNTITYGHAAASFLAIRCLFQLAQECEENQPEISELIKDSFYVDDFLYGAETIEKAAHDCEIILKVLESGCFPLRKWFSNEPKILENFTKSDDNFNILEFGEKENTKMLGLIYSGSSDWLTYKIILPTKLEKITKRAILSHTARIFDPLGLLAPSIIIVKILLQKLWLEKLSWDEALPSGIHTLWAKFRDELSFYNELKVPRHVICLNVDTVELHGFSDASNNAYGGCIYIRSIDKDGNITIRLLIAKSKVAPLKPLTIPKLELCGALILARLVEKVKNSLSISFDRCVLWCDSTIVLGWLKTPPNNLNTFVCNRVAEIQNKTESCVWRHVPTNSNPADSLSRGVFPSQMLKLNLWWNGPQWLGQSEEHWPNSSRSVEHLPELRVKNQLFVFISLEFESNIFNRFSKFNRLKRTVSWMLRFINRCKVNKAGRNYHNNGPLTVKETDAAVLCLVRLSQKISFPEDYASLESGQSLNNKSKLLSLNPFIKDGVIRVGGRLTNSDYEFDKKYPMVISSKHRLAKLIFEYEHVRLLHAGPQLLLGSIREKYWPIAGRNLAKMTVRKCHKCFRFNPSITQPIMGDLPKSRLISGQVFNIVGIDYMGPLTIKDRKGRGAKFSKCYVSVFVCFATKAIHLELVTELTSQAFIMAFRRFVSRRGKPSHVYCDNGLTFIGANRELKELGEFLRDNKDSLMQSYAQENVQFHYIPAYSPHFGGLWEAGVKSSKFHLKRVAGSANLDFEELYTLLTQIESILNSRPLFPLSSDPSDVSPLTPAHFLVGKALTELPDPDLKHISESRLSRYQRIQQIKQNFWTRWNKEYVSELQQRVKWKSTQSQLQEGTLVLIKEDNTPSLQWRLGRVVAVHAGKDNVNRVASVKTTNGIIKRAFTKVCPLPLNEPDVEEVLQGGGHV